MPFTPRKAATIISEFSFRVYFRKCLFHAPFSWIRLEGTCRHLRYRHGAIGCVRACDFLARFTLPHIERQSPSGPPLRQLLSLSAPSHAISRQRILGFMREPEPPGHCQIVSGRGRLYTDGQHRSPRARFDAPILDTPRTSAGFGTPLRVAGALFRQMMSWRELISFPLSPKAFFLYTSMRFFHTYDKPAYDRPRHAHIQPHAASQSSTRPRSAWSSPLHQPDVAASFRHFIGQLLITISPHRRAARL